MSAGGGWGALAQFGTDLMNVGHSAIQNRKARKFAREFAEYTTRNTPTWRMEGLKAAGINPILAAGGGVGTAGGSFGGAGMIGGSARGGYASEARTSSLMKTELQKLKHETATARWVQKQAKHQATAAEFLPQRAKTAWETEIAQRNHARYRSQLSGSQVPQAEILRDYYRQSSARQLKAWNETMRNIFGAAPKAMPIYRGK